jgi:hypothetical protein
MFDKDIVLKGKHAAYIKFLSEKTEKLNKDVKTISLFSRYIDVFMVGALIGAFNRKIAEKDNTSSESATIFADAVIKEKLNLDYIYKLVLLNDNTKKLSNDQKVDEIFRHDGDFELFMQYVRGGIESLYEHFTEGATTKDDYYDKMTELVEDIRSHLLDNNTLKEKLTKML